MLFFRCIRTFLYCFIAIILINVIQAMLIVLVLCHFLTYELFFFFAVSSPLIEYFSILKYFKIVFCIWYFKILRLKYLVFGILKQSCQSILPTSGYNQRRVSIQTFMLTVRTTTQANSLYM